MTNNLIRRRACVVSAAVSLLGAASLGGAPTAKADILWLDNGLGVEISAPNPNTRDILVAYLPADYADDVVNVLFPVGNQFQSESFTVTRSQTPVRLEACHTRTLAPSECTPWSSFDPFKNLPDPPPPPPPPPGAPEMCSPGLCPASPPPKRLPPPPPPVTDAITLSFGPPQITLIPPSASITATVSNSSDLTAKCTYDATPDFNSHRDFTVNPHGSTDLTFNGFATGTSYHVKVSCRDASGKQTQEIGHPEQNVTF
jgi:hypothetical protein